MVNNAGEFFKSIKGKKIAFLGIGVTNTPNIYMFLDMGFSVGVCDVKEKEQIEEYEILKDMGVNFFLGDKYLLGLEEYDIIFRAPGFYFYHEKLTDLRNKGKVVTSELELFLKLCPATVVGVTGSDGKSTTTSIIYEMLKQMKKTTYLGGNIGKNILTRIFDITPSDYVVLELSSFQLISMRQSPNISVITNITPNHLNVHKDMDEYVKAKENIFIHQTCFDRVIFNMDNGITSGYIKKTINETMAFSVKRLPKQGAYLNQKNEICFSCNGESQTLFSADIIKIPGKHNVENYLAAISALFGIVDVETMKYVAENFLGVEHRMELVKEKDGKRWYNDVIATSPSRTMAALHTFSEKIILIAGGADKKLTYGPLGPEIVKNVKVLILAGETAKKIEKAVIETSGYEESNLKIIHSGDLADAVNTAEKNASFGDIIVLSPASTSYDVYTNFEEKGRHFKNLVNKL